MMFAGATTLGGAAAAYCLGKKNMVFLGKDEQLRVEQMTEVVVHRGPGLKVLTPFAYRSAKVEKATMLGVTDYAKVRDKVDGSEKVIKGPQLLFLGAYEAVVENGQGLSLSATEYVRVVNQVTGDVSVERGPSIWFPKAQERGEKGTAVNLSSTEYVRIEDRATGMERVEQGPLVWFPGPLEKGTKGSGLSLSSTEYVLVVDKRTGEKRVQPGPCVWFPGPSETGTKAAGISLSSTEFVLVEDSLTGDRRVERGPRVWFPGPHETGSRGDATSLGATEYVAVEDALTGDKKLVRGPCVWFPSPYDTVSSTKTAIALQDDEYVRLKDGHSGKRWIQKGKALVFLEPTWEVERASIRKAMVLKAYEYVRLVDATTGKVTTHRGEATVFPGPDEEPLDGDKISAIDLKVNEYVKIIDQATGDIRVEAGTTQVFLGPHEKVLDGGKKKAVEVDGEHAALVRNKSTGQLRLVTESQLFVPGPHESIEAVQELVKLADHEAIIVKDKDGVFHYHYGSDEKRAPDQPRCFFLPPYAEVVKLCWSRGRRRECRDLYIERFDTRAQYMSFEFNCRTKDNVELILEGTFFWEVTDLPRMVRATGDTSGDLCNHARSQFIKHVAKVTLKEFMDDLQSISNKVHQEDSEFYATRGVKVHSLEVTAYRCADASTSEVLQQIIQETTNRMNRLSQAESENEVKLYRMQGEIDQERLNGQLLEIQHGHAQAEARVCGKSEADRAAAFVDGLKDHVPKLEDRLALWQTLRKTDALSAISGGGSNFYYTPSDVNLSIEGGAPRG
mmetsp:Transcript_68744/g.179081  ORF Transcript_68744/g.179081 Transcript_68744/m.179081 type:complete len:787 (+) Transcript_68744:106-2466(+)